MIYYPIRDTVTSVVRPPNPSAVHAKGGGANVEESVAGSPAGSSFAVSFLYKSVLTTQGTSGQLIFNA